MGPNRWDKNTDPSKRALKDIEKQLGQNNRVLINKSKLIDINRRIQTDKSK